MSVAGGQPPNFPATNKTLILFFSLFPAPHFAAALILFGKQVSISAADNDTEHDFVSHCSS
jgi:hypothetical protein